MVQCQSYGGERTVANLLEENGYFDRMVHQDRKCGVGGGEGLRGRQ
jgi:hypothetical protein